MSPLFFLLKLWNSHSYAAVVSELLFSCGHPDVPQFWELNAGALKVHLNWLETAHESKVALLSSWAVCCSAFWCNTPHKSPRQRHCPYLVHAGSREAPVETAVMTFTALLGASAFQLFFTAAGTGCQVQEVPAPNCIGIILYNTIEPSSCLPVTCTVLRVVFARGNATFLWW